MNSANESTHSIGQLVHLLNRCKYACRKSHLHLLFTTRTAIWGIVSFGTILDIGKMTSVLLDHGLTIPYFSYAP